MKRIAAILAMVMVLTVSAHAYEVFTASAGTGTQTAYSNVDIDNGGWGGFPGDPNATFYYNSIASNWVLIFANWGNGNGYASISIDTNHATGWYDVGYVNSTGQEIWVILQ